MRFLKVCWSNVQDTVRSYVLNTPKPFLNLYSFIHNGNKVVFFSEFKLYYYQLVGKQIKQNGIFLFQLLAGFYIAGNNEKTRRSM